MTGGTGCPNAMLTLHGTPCLTYPISKEIKVFKEIGTPECVGGAWGRGHRGVVWGACLKIRQQAADRWVHPGKASVGHQDKSESKCAKRATLPPQEEAAMDGRSAGLAKGYSGREEQRDWG